MMNQRWTKRCYLRTGCIYKVSDKLHWYFLAEADHSHNGSPRIPNPVYDAFLLLPPSLHTWCPPRGLTWVWSDCCLYMSVIRSSLPCLGAHGTSLYQRISPHHTAHLLLSKVTRPPEHPWERRPLDLRRYSAFLASALAVSGRSQSMQYILQNTLTLRPLQSMSTSI